MLTIADIMTSTVEVVLPTDTVAAAIAHMRASGLRSLIVDRPSPKASYGIVTERDIVYKVMAPGLEPEQVRVHSIMRQPCIALEPHLSLQAAAVIMSNSGIQRAPVIQNGTLLGIVSVTDLVMKGMAVHPIDFPAS